jgi:hypothetical protein
MMIVMGDIEARVTHTGSAIRVENQNSWSWTDVELELNGSYTYHLSRLGAGTSRTIQLSSFSDDEGFRFSSYQKAKSFWIMCEDPSGDRKYYSGSWN